VPLTNFEFSLDKPELVEALLYITQKGRAVREKQIHAEKKSMEWSITIVIKKIEKSLGMLAASS